MSAAGAWATLEAALEVALQFGNALGNAPDVELCEAEAEETAGAHEVLHRTAADVYKHLLVVLRSLCLKKCLEEGPAYGA